MTFFHGEPKFTAEYPQPLPTMAGCWFDGSHQSNMDLSVWLIEAAKAWGAKWEDPTDAEVYAYLTSTAFSDVTDQEAVFLHEASEEALTWLTCNVAPEDHVFYLDESCVFMEKYGEVTQN